MKPERKIELFDELVAYIADKAADGYKTEDEMRDIFLQIGFTKEEYQREIQLEDESRPAAAVTTVCYGKVEQWESRDKAAAFFLDGMMCSDGSECERYTKIYTEIVSGKDVCTDVDERGTEMNKNANELFTEVLDELGFSIERAREGGEDGYAIYDNQLGDYRKDEDGSLIIAHDAGEILEELATYVEDSYNRDLEEEWENHGLQERCDPPETLEGWVRLVRAFEHSSDQEERDFFAAHKDEIDLCDLIANRFDEVNPDEVILFKNYCKETYEKVSALEAGGSYVTADFPCDGMEIRYDKSEGYNENDPDSNVVSLCFEYNGRLLVESNDEHIDDLPFKDIRNGSYNNFARGDKPLGELIAQRDGEKRPQDKARRNDGREL